MTSDDTQASGDTPVSNETSAPSELDALSLELRVARLEGRLGWRRVDYVLMPKLAAISAGVLMAALLMGLFGLGMPNHYYQLVLAALAVALAYHREWLIAPKEAFLLWPLAALNTAVLTILFKLLIGSGNRFPFHWVLYPAVTKSGPPEAGEKWADMIPNWELTWQASTLSGWSIDLTIIQTFLMLITLIGALFDFQPFISFTALLLIIVSIPALVGFNWTWVFPAIVAAAGAIYLQSAALQEDQQGM